MRIFGYCAVTADFLHIGHLNFLEACRKQCRHLTVGIMTDSCVEKYKKRKPIMNQEDRARLVMSLKCVDMVAFQDTFEFPDLPDFIIFDSEEHKRKGAEIFVPRMEGISSTMLREAIN